MGSAEGAVLTPFQGAPCEDDTLSLAKAAQEGASCNQGGVCALRLHLLCSGTGTEVLVLSPAFAPRVKGTPLAEAVRVAPGPLCVDKKHLMGTRDGLVGAESL